MAVIGGYFGGGRDRRNGVTLSDISRSMIDFGGRREAFIKGRIGISVGLDKERSDDSGLYFYEHDGEVFAAVVSGNPGKFSGVDILSSYAMQKSLRDEYPLGVFSAAVCNGNDELFVFRSGDESPPIYYGVYDGDFAFASRIRGLIGFLGGSFVRLDILRSHLTSAAGRYTAEDIYDGIYGVEKNGGLRFTPNGVSRFFLKPCEKSERISENTTPFVGSFVCPDREKMRETLMEILMAFDYPQFDPYMPTFIRDIRQEDRVIDHSLCMDTRYSEERRSCLSAFYKRCSEVVPPASQSYRENELLEMDDLLRALLIEDESDVYSIVLGKNWRDVMDKEKNTVRRIRIRGMLWQTAFWYEKYNLSFI